MHVPSPTPLLAPPPLCATGMPAAEQSDAPHACLSRHPATHLCVQSAYLQLSEAMRDRSSMRTQLAQVRLRVAGEWAQGWPAGGWPALEAAWAASPLSSHTPSPPPHSLSLPTYLPRVQTHAELAETRTELEQLADDILAIKVLIDEEQGVTSSQPGTASYDTASYATGSSGTADDDALDVLQSLAALSRQLAADAAADDELVASIQRLDSAAEQLGAIEQQL